MGLYLGTQNLLEGVGNVDGTGTPNYLTKWNDADTIEDSIISDDGNRATVSGALTVTQSTTLSGIGATALLPFVGIAANGVLSAVAAPESINVNTGNNTVPVSNGDSTAFVDSPITIASTSRVGTGTFENVNVFTFLTSNSTTLHLSTNGGVLSSAIVGEFYEFQADSTRFIEVTAVGGSAITFSGTFSSDEFFNGIILSLRATTAPSSTATVGSDITVTGTTTIDSAITGLLRADAGVVSDSGVPITAATGTSTVINATLSAGQTIGSTEVSVNGTDAPAIQAILDAGGTVSFTFSNNIETPLVIGSAAAIDGGTYRLSGLVPGLQSSYAVNTAIVITSIPVLTIIEGNLAVTGNSSTAGNSYARRGSFGTSANPSFDLYNNGTSYFNEVVTVDAALNQTGGATSTFSGVVSLDGTNQIYFEPQAGESNSEAMRIVRSSDKMFFTYGINAPDTAFSFDSSGNTNFAKNVGIGTDTPSALLELQTVSTSGNADFQIFSRGEQPNYEVFKISRSAGSTELLANQNLTLSADYDANHTSVDSNITFKTDNTEKMRIASDGNVGVGTGNAIPAYGSGYSALQLGVDNGLFSDTATNAGSALTFGQNAYNDGTNFKYTGAASNEAGILDMKNGTLSFSNAPAGVADADATMSEVIRLGSYGASAGPTGVLQVGSISSTKTASLLGRQTSVTTGLALMATTPDTNTSGDMLFDVRENNNSTFATLTNPAFKFVHYGNTLLNILRNGHVGIGTAAPDTALTVNGSIGLSYNATSSFQGMKRGDIYTETEFYNVTTSDATKPLYNFTNSTGASNLVITQGGNIGIGTLTPDALLDIESANVDTARIRLGCTRDGTWAVGNTIGSLDFFSADTNAPGAVLRGSVSMKAEIASGADMGMAFATYNNTERMRIAATGNVGIGSNAPASKLTLEGNTNSYAQAPVIRFDSSATNANVRNWGIGPADSNHGNFHIYKSGAIGNNPITGDAAKTFTIDYQGNVGVGTDTPGALLQVQAAEGSTGTIEVNGGPINGAVGTINSELNFGSLDTSVIGGLGGSIKSVNETTNGALLGMSFHTYKQGRTAGTNADDLKEAMRITNTGNVGIGVTGAYSSNNDLNLSGKGVSFKNDASGSNNNWSHITNTATGSSSNLAFSTGQVAGALVMSHTGLMNLSAYGAGTLVSDASGNITSSADGGVADNSITHDKLEPRYTAKATSAATGNQNIDASTATTFLLTGNIATATLNVTNLKLGQSIDIVLSGSLSNAVLTIATDFTTSTISKVGDTGLDTSVTNIIQIVCLDDTDSAAQVVYSINKYATDTTP